MPDMYMLREECNHCGALLDLFIDEDSLRKAWKECSSCGHVPSALVPETGQETVMESFTAITDCVYCGREAGTKHKPSCSERFELMRFVGMYRDDSKPEDDVGPKTFTTQTEERDDMKHDKNENPKNATVKMVGDAVAHGGKVAVASEAGDVLLEIAQAALGDKYPDLFQTDEGKQIAKMTVAIMLHYGTDSHPGAFPAPEAIGKACECVVEGSARDLIQPRLTALRPKLDKLATVGRRLKQIEDKEATESKPNGASTFMPAGQASED